MWINSPDVEGTKDKFGKIIEIITEKIKEKGGELELNQEVYVTDIESGFE